MAKRRFEVLCRQFPNLAPEKIVCVLIHVPKTGGRSLRYWLNEYFPIWNIQSTKDARTNPPEGRYVIYTGHSSPDILIGPRLLAPQVANGLTSIAVVRNPYDRAVSLFHHFVRHGGYEDTLDHFLQLAKRSIKNPSTAEGRRLKRMCLPATFWTKPKSWSGPTHILRFEELDEELEEVARVVGIEGPAEARGAATINLPRALVGRKEQEKILELYNDDFMNFEYSISIPEHLAR